MVQQAVLQQRRQKVVTNSKGNLRSKLPSIPQKSSSKHKKVLRPPTSQPSLPKIEEKAVVEPSILELATRRLNSAPNSNDNSCGNVVLHFNHYHKSFPIHNGVLKWEDIDKEYYLSFAYSGNFKRTITQLPQLIEGENLYKRNAVLFSSDSSVPSNELLHDENYHYFIGAVDQQQYLLKVEEDSTLNVEIKLAHADTLTFSQLDPTAKSGNRAVSLLTAELKSLSPHDLNTDHAKLLMEQRDLEDILFSS